MNSYVETATNKLYKCIKLQHLLTKAAAVAEKSRNQSIKVVIWWLYLSY